MSPTVSTSEATGLPCVVLQHPNGGKVEVQLHGSTVTSFKTSRGTDVLFLSEKAVFNGVKAIRGGIPLVFPQFGQPDKSMASHGFGRVSTWRLSEEDPSEEEGHMKACFVLEHSDETMSQWGHPFRLCYEVDLGEDVLSVTLNISNPGSDSFEFQSLLHTYLKVPEIEDTKIEGFEGVSYKDQLKGGEIFKEERPCAVFGEEVDRIYSGEIGDIQIVGGTKVANSCVKSGPGGEESIPVDVVLWNPWIVKSQKMADFGDEEYHQMVCIEPGIVAKKHSIAPGETYSLKQVITPA